MQHLPTWVAANPIASFTLLLFASLTVPPLVERLKLPGLVGLLLAGVILGPYGLQLLNPETETVKLLSDIGKIYLMFVAGLEIDRAAFRETRNRSLKFGLTTFLVPLIAGTLVGQVFGFGLNASLLIGSLLASHTLLAYPLIQQFGVVRNPAIAVTVGATIFTDVSALLVLAICVSIHQGQFSWVGLILQLVSLAIYAAAVLIGLDRLGREYFQRTGNEEGNQFLFVLLSLFLASVGTQVIQIENIVGAFLAGLAVSDVLGHGPVKEKVEFVGAVLFIPFFFVCMGLLIDIQTFLYTLGNEPMLAIAIVGSLIGSKFIAAWIVKGVDRYTWIETLTMWSLSLPQVAATLAAALVGFQVGLLTEPVFNSVIVLMLVTAILGPVLTERFAKQLMISGDGATSKDLQRSNNRFSTDRPLAILVPVNNPATEPNLMTMAGLLVQQQGGRVMPLAIAQTSSTLNDPRFLESLSRKRSVLQQAAEHSLNLGVETQPLLRIDLDIALGICHAAKEQEADLVLMGYGDITTLQARLLGNIIDQVFQSSPSPVAVMRLLAAPKLLSRILVFIWDISPHTLKLIAFAQSIATANQGNITLKYLISASTPPEKQGEFELQLRQHLVFGLEEEYHQIEIEAIVNTHPATVILETAHNFDLIILNAKDIHPGKGLILNDWATPIIQGLDCSMILFSNP
ncbi:cation:proton antiporter [Roseofilum sp. BLCC_M154]|uniref:Cation:proton antiporter n=1 Tax=Roseofilum acuticapitatum BLCC-M154 TaxID=3022444 RepID=A0ABT7ANS7_9CYAN|nr:cation:proton antiporter [Roseofilum acuticapitatum]MDJ1168540.1 cation:proton antiporter [Roseofilum acuticapitatum BLCC-M154]